MKWICVMIRSYAATGTTGLAGSCRVERVSPSHQDSAPTPDAPGIDAVLAVAAELLAYSDQRDAEHAERLAAEARGYARGAADGYTLGVGDRLEATAAAQRELAPVVRRLADRPDAAELERRRWSVRGEPRTRAEFAAPHPGDRGPFGAEQLAAIAAAWEAGLQ